MITALFMLACFWICHEVMERLRAKKLQTQLVRERQRAAEEGQQKYEGGGGVGGATIQTVLPSVPKRIVFDEEDGQERLPLLPGEKSRIGDFGSGSDLYQQHLQQQQLQNSPLKFSPPREPQILNRSGNGSSVSIRGVIQEHHMHTYSSTVDLHPFTFRVGHFGFGFFLGMCSHVLLDSLIWFSSIDLTWPLSWITNDAVQPVSIWQNVKIPDVINSGLSVAEMMTAGLAFTALRLRLPVHDHAAEEILAPKIRFVELLHYGFFFVLLLVYIALAIWEPILESYVIFLVTFIPLLTFTVPAFYYLSWRTRKYLLFPASYERQRLM